MADNNPGEPRANTPPTAGVRLSLLQRIGRRGTSMLFFALLDMIYAFSLFRPPAESRQSASSKFVETVAPLWLWALLWAAAGVVCLVNAFRVSDRLGFAAAIAIKVVWGLLYVAAAVAGVERAYVGAAIWLCLAGWVAIISTWPEAPGGSVRRQPDWKW